LIANPRWHLAHQAGDFHAGLDKAEDIVDEQQHIPLFVVAEVFGHRQRGMPHAEPCAWRFVHLAEEHHHFRQDARFFHVAVKLLAFATALADAAENTHAVLMPDSHQTGTAFLPRNNS